MLNSPISPIDRDARQDNWNAYACDVSETLLLSTAKKIVDWGLRDLGYTHIILDDCWATTRGSNGSIMPNMTRFPNGMAAIADELHGMGLKYGMYSSAGEVSQPSQTWDLVCVTAENLAVHLCRLPR